jgi:general secretion pathway protein A
MYKRFYGFTRAPFDLTPDPERVFMSWTHKEGLAVLEYGVVARKGFLVLTGAVGTGKTTLLQALVHSLEGNVHFCLVNNPKLSREEFFSFLAHEYDLVWDGNKALFLIEFSKFLKECAAKNERVLLIIDEAHVIPVAQMEEIRLLSNQDMTGGNVFSIFLVGQPELDAHLNEERLLPLRQRIGIRFHLERFSRDITIQYIVYRLRMAGAKHLDIFTEDALSLIHAVSKGTPRLINIICDHALLIGFADDKPVIDAEIIRECIKELHLSSEDELPTETSGSKWTRQYRLLAVSVGVVMLALLLLEFFPQTRAYSPLGKLLPENWLLSLHHLYENIGG